MKQNKKNIIKLANDIFKFEGLVLNKKEQEMLKLLANKQISQKEYINLVKSGLNV